MKHFILLFFCLQCVFAAGNHLQDWNVTEHNIVGDGQTLNTVPLQSLINRVSAKGGGRLIFPIGNYLCGSLQLKSGIELYLEEGAVLLGSTNPYHYANEKGKLEEAFLVASEATGIRITGAGTVDGQGLGLALTIDSLHHTGEWIDSTYNYRRMRPGNRPKLCCFTHCNDVRFEGVTFRNSAGWGLSFHESSHISIHNVTVSNRAYWNNDGIDLTDCSDVHIWECDVDAADDGICLKSENKHADNRNISINDCTVISSASAIKFGTSSWGNFRDVTISRIQVKDTFRSAIAIESVDGGNIENIQIFDIFATNTGNALFIRLGHRNGDKAGSVKNVTVKNLWCEVPFGRPDIAYDLRGPEVNYFHNPFPCVISGIPEAMIQEVLLEDIEVVFPGRASKGMAYIPISRLQAVPEKTDEYPEFTMFGELPSWGFYTRHVEGLQMKNIRLILKEDDHRPSLVFDNVKQASVRSVRFYPIKPTKNQIVMKESDVCIE